MTGLPLTAVADTFTISTPICTNQYYHIYIHVKKCIIHLLCELKDICLIHKLTKSWGNWIQSYRDIQASREWRRPLVLQSVPISPLYIVTAGPTYSSCDDDSVGGAKTESVGYNEVTSVLMNDEGILYTNI